MEGQEPNQELSKMEPIDNIDKTKEEGEMEKSVKFESVYVGQIGRGYHVDYVNYDDENGKLKEAHQGQVIGRNISLEDALKLMENLEQDNSYRYNDSNYFTLCGLLPNGRIVEIRNLKDSSWRLKEFEKSKLKK